LAVGAALDLGELGDPAPEVLLGAVLGGEVSLKQLEGERLADDLGAEAEYVDVVVLDTLVRRVDVVAERGANAGHLVGGNAGADAGAADHHAAVGLARAD